MTRRGRHTGGPGGQRRTLPAMVDSDLALSALGYPRRGLHGRVVDELGRHVVGGRWSAGAPMPREEELAAELGVSRTVVRESIKVLQSKGLVEVRPKTGTRVRARRAWHLLDADVVAWQFADMARADDVDELQEIRIAIEVAAARLAAGRRTDAQLAEIEANERRIHAAADEPLARTVAELDFHRAVVDAAQNTLLAHVNAMIRIALEAIGAPSAEHAELERRSARSRAAVSRAIRTGDADAAGAAMRALIEHEWKRMSKDRG